MSDDRPVAMMVVPAIRIQRITDERFLAQFVGDEDGKIVGGSSRERAVSMLAKLFPGRFHLDPTELDRPSQKFGTIILSYPEAFGITIIEE